MSRCWHARCDARCIFPILHGSQKKLALSSIWIPSTNSFLTMILIVSGLMCPNLLCHCCSLETCDTLVLSMDLGQNNKRYCCDSSLIPMETILLFFVSTNFHSLPLQIWTYPRDGTVPVEKRFWSNSGTCCTFLIFLGSHWLSTHASISIVPVPCTRIFLPSAITMTLSFWHFS